MAIEIVMPRMGLTMEEGTLVSWLKSEDETVQAGEPLLEIATDKTVMEIEAPGSGILSGLVAQPDETFPVGAVIGYLLSEGETLPAGEQVEAAAATPSAASVQATRAAAAGDESKVGASPAARHLARTLDVDLSSVSGSGPRGRVVAWNVENTARAATTVGQPASVSPVAQRLAAELEVDLSTVQGTGPGSRVMRGDVEQAAGSTAIRPETAQPVIAEAIQPISRAHRLMADRMALSSRAAPHVYLHAEVNARRLLALRQDLLDSLEESTGLRITITDLLLKLTAVVLGRHPQVMAQWTDAGLLLPAGVNVGLAIDSPSGLIVPVLRDADQLGLAAVAQRRIDLVERASKGQLLPRDLELGVFTVTNLGMFGIDSFDAIINPPQSAILAVGSIKERPVVEQGKLVAAPTCHISLSVDHRVIDGATAARFLGELVKLMEMPALAMA